MRRVSDDRADLGVRHRTRPGLESDPLDRLVRVLGPIEPGSLIVVDERALGIDHGDAAQLTHVLEAVGEVVGHRRWLLLVVPDTGLVRVLGPSDVSAAFRNLLVTLTQDREPEVVVVGDGAGNTYRYMGGVGPLPAHDPDCGLPADHPGLCAP